MEKITVFQSYLMTRKNLSRKICKRLNADRSTVYKWSCGQCYPHRIHATALISLFAEYGIKLDYNDIYSETLKIAELDTAL